MILVDTSVWVHHLRHSNSRLRNLLESEIVYCHPLIIGELACGHMKNRKEVLSLLEKLPQAQIIDHEEAMVFIDKHSLTGKGLGFIDIHLLASVSLSALSILTEDRALQQSARRLGLLYQ